MSAMRPSSMNAAHFSTDICEFIGLLHQHDVRYVIVGGEAVIFHGHARLTGDIDFFYEASTDERFLNSGMAGCLEFRQHRIYWSRVSSSNSGDRRTGSI